MIRRFLALIFFAAIALAQRPFTVAQLTEYIQSEIKFKRDDRQTAAFLKTIKLTQKLDDRAIEELQGQGAGPKTVAELRRLAEASAGLQPPPPPAVKPAPPPPPPPPDSVEQAEALDGMREYALSYTQKLPNYICTQITRRHLDPTDPKYRPQGDKIQEELTFFDKKEDYKVKMINDQAVANVSHYQLGGVVSSGEFGSMLHNIFAPESEAVFNWERWATLRGKRMYVFSFRIEKEHGYGMEAYDKDKSRRHYISAYRGFVYGDHETKAVMRIKMEAVEIPSDFPVKEVAMQLDYNPTPVGPETYVLPFHMELTSRLYNASSKNEADYRFYRMYGTESTIKFSDEPIPEDQLKETPAQADSKDKKPDTPPVKKPDKP